MKSGTIDHAVLPYRLTFDQSLMNMQAVHAYLTTAYWSKSIPLDVVQRGFANALAIGLLTADGQTVGAARVITDRATFGYLADVFILEDHRGQKLAPWMVGQLLSHPDLQGLRRMMLATSDMHDLYRKVGFASLASPEKIMEIVKPDIYQSV